MRSEIASSTVRMDARFLRKVIARKRSRVAVQVMARSSALRRVFRMFLFARSSLS